MDNVIGIGLAGGSGVRIRPLTLKAPGYLRAKAAITLLGRRLMDWIIMLLKVQGLDDYVLVTKGKENRYQIKQIVGYGEEYGVRIRYSPVSLDSINVGSADALLSNIEFFNLEGTAVVFATDTVFDIDLPAMLAHHARTGAVATIAITNYPPAEIAGRYGLARCAADGAVASFHEKPSLDQINRLYGVDDHAELPSLATNSGFYIFDIAALREIGRLPEINEKRLHSFDIGGDLLPWMVAHGCPVQTFAIGRMGDLGNIPSYLDTMLDVLRGNFYSINPCVLEDDACADHLMIDPVTLALRDPISNLTLAEKMQRGIVHITPPVRIGRYVRIFPGVTITDSNIDDDCEIFEGATILRSSVGPGSLIGAGSYLEDALLGFMVDLQSTPEHPIRLTKRTALGDEVVVRAAVNLEGAVIHPRLKLPAGIRIPPNVDVESIAQLHEYL